MALVIAGERSSVGKTTVALMILAALGRGRVGQAGMKIPASDSNIADATVQSFKVGPDYIDPMFHRYVTGRPCYNLDPVLTSEAAVQRCFAGHQAADYALVEGVMGLFDGTVWTATGPRPWGENSEFDQPQASAFASTAHLAKLLDLPVLLVLDCSRLSGSVAAIALGYTTLDPAVQIAGLVLNRVGSDRHLTLLKTALEPLGIPILGVLRRHREIELRDRHLGLVPTDELPELEQRIDRLAEIAESAFDWEQLLPLLAAEPARATPPSPIAHAGKNRRQAAVRIGIARDRAFNFYYAENLELLERAGAELVFWSPLEDEAMPENLQGLMLGGGFPEVFAEQLSSNGMVLAGVKAAIAAGIPTYAECGGLMYLCRGLRDLAGQTWPMVGLLPATAVMDRLTLGYRRAVVLGSTPLLTAGAEVWGHEFHHSRLAWEAEGHAALFELWGNDLAGARLEGFGLGGDRGNLHASYVHLHWGALPGLALRFVDQCRRFSLPAKIRPSSEA
ncbi:MAG: cobyrinate a,c-diamide synthase [Synechococcales cyanobacterium RM1_1_8]|nr:cobyrinate a,c-diamide synthase [Synechococcales cyanobacterium RM1_1_8]